MNARIYANKYDIHQALNTLNSLLKEQLIL